MHIRDMVRLLLALSLTAGCGASDPLSDLCEPGTIVCGNRCCELCQRDIDCGANSSCDEGVCAAREATAMLPESSSPTSPAPQDPRASDPEDDPVPADPSPSDPAPDDPAPSDPAPTDPAPTTPVCDATTCPDGCCDAAGMCREGEASACGIDGGACVDCTADGGTDSCSPAGTCTCAATGATCWGSTPACTPSGCRACADDSLHILPVTYEKTCDRKTGQCQSLESGGSYIGFISGEDRMNYVRFDTSGIPSGARVTDVMFALYPGPGGMTCGGMLGATESAVDAFLSATPRLHGSFAWNPAMACGDMTQDAEAFDLPGCGWQQCTWTRSSSIVTRVPLDAMVQGWLDGTLANHGFGFVMWGGEAATYGANPGITMAVCVQ